MCSIAGEREKVRNAKAGTSQESKFIVLQHYKQQANAKDDKRLSLYPNV
jgi:hypothetical protein